MSEIRKIIDIKIDNAEKIIKQKGNCPGVNCELCPCHNRSCMVDNYDREFNVMVAKKYIRMMKD